MVQFTCITIFHHYGDILLLNQFTCPPTKDAILICDVILDKAHCSVLEAPRLDRLVKEQLGKGSRDSKPKSTQHHQNPHHILWQEGWAYV